MASSKRTAASADLLGEYPLPASRTKFMNAPTQTARPTKQIAVAWTRNLEPWNRSPSMNPTKQATPQGARRRAKTARLKLLKRNCCEMRAKWP